MRRPHRMRAVVLSVSLLGLTHAVALGDLVAPLTGDATVDLPSSESNVFVIPDRSDDVAQSQWMTDRGWSSGWNIQDLRMAYNSNTDTLTVGVNFLGIAGDADGNSNPGTADPLTTSSGGLDLPNLGGRESITIGFAKLGPNGTMGDPILVAGVSAVKQPGGGGGIDGFTVAQYVNRGGLAYNYGQSLAGNIGELAFDPSAAHPDFVFTIKNVTSLGFFAPLAGFYVSAFAGSPDDVVSGEDTIGWTHVPGFKPIPQGVPEPSSLVLLGLGGAIGLFGFRRRRAAKMASV